MLELRQVSKRFAAKEVLSGFSYAFAEGETACLIGPSGCGKTTLLRVASGLLAPDAGSVAVPEGRLAFLFQEDRLLPWYGALKNITVTGADTDAAGAALAAVGLSGEEATLPGKLSGGMRRRVAIARAIAFGGDFFSLDEPLRGLDEATAGQVTGALRGAIHGKTALLVTHRAEEALALSDRVLLLGGPPLRITKEARTRDFGCVDALKEWITCGFQ